MMRATAAPISGACGIRFASTGSCSGSPPYPSPAFAWITVCLRFLPRYFPLGPGALPQPTIYAELPPGFPEEADTLHSGRLSGFGSRHFMGVLLLAKRGHRRTGALVLAALAIEFLICNVSTKKYGCRTAPL